MLRRVAAITQGEFLQALQTSRPPNGWAKKIAVANSGGPDSTCLLFLMDKLLSDPEVSGKGLPMTTLSLTVNHGLQESSNTMATQCERNAKSLRVDHLTSTIPWGETPFPSRPVESSAFEGLARDARYHLLFDAMTRMDVNTLAFGHHADDQVETALMRLARGTSEIGAGGMRPCRRWGMGMSNLEGGLAWAGYEGMRRWIIRPMLSFSKDRILATCEENKLEYVVDPTNFQPDVTLRNAIRHTLAAAEADSNGTPLPPRPEGESLSGEVHAQVEKMKVAAEQLKEAHYDISGGAAQLRGAVRELTARVSDINAEVDRHLKRRTIPSPVGTFLLAAQDLAAIEDPTVRAAIVLRILRYVSFHPWGSVRAEGNRRSQRLQQIVDLVWAPDPLHLESRHLVAGSGVLWRLAIFRQEEDGRMVLRLPDKSAAHTVKPGERLGWLASRQPPPKKSSQWATARRQNALDEVDLSDELLRAQKAAMGGGAKPFQVLFDNRFLLRFDMDKMPATLATSLAMGRSKIVLGAVTNWQWPHVEWVRGNHKEGRTTLAFVNDPNVNSTNAQEASIDPLLDGWITIEWIRASDAT
ncbi:hypothetical protein FIBSPDRAFT_1044298 [Athelia psychrophila]|uniref:tRNA(Ile)-lysidine synthetase n=1 Tax=Athelia psychrophila TaxID=1759441 RepID=A0A166JR39_9AGAM|nr:hypothetical protein FIBSPDRAFT_1044298 [Fibularhizoctonia sp. CBS 109695]